MKKISIAAILSITAMVAAHAAPSRANDGDVLVAFSSVNSDINYTVNLGSRANFASNFSSMLADIRTDLVSVYGSADVFDNLNVSWGGASSFSDDSTLYATVAAGTTGWTPSSVGSDSLQTFAATKIGVVRTNYNRYISNATEGTIGLAGVFVQKSDEDSWYSLHTAIMSGSPFDYFNGSLEGNLRDGLTFYSLDSANGYGSDPTSVTTLNSVPEPSTYFLMGAGALLLIVCYRNKKNA